MVHAGDCICEVQDRAGSPRGSLCFSLTFEMYPGRTPATPWDTAAEADEGPLHQPFLQVSVIHHFAFLLFLSLSEAAQRLEQCSDRK